MFYTKRIMKTSRDGRNLRDAHVFRFESMARFGAHVKSLIDNNVKQANNASEKRSSASWCSDTLDRAVSRACNGGHWPEGLERLNDVVAQGNLSGFKATTITDDYSLDHGHQGGCVDVGEYLSGSPECFYGIQYDEKPTPIIKIGVSVTHSSGVSSDYIMNRGAAIVSLIMALEKQGYSVELVAVCLHAKTASRKPFSEFNIVLKQTGDELSEASIVYALAHSGFSRRLSFRVLESCEHETAADEGYGCGLYSAECGDYSHNKEQFDLFFGGICNGKQYPYRSPKTALETVFDLAQKQHPELQLTAA